MTVELDEIDFKDKVVIGRDGVKRRQLSLVPVSATPPSKSEVKNTPAPPIRTSDRDFVTFIERSLPREYDE